MNTTDKLAEALRDFLEEADGGIVATPCTRESARAALAAYEAEAKPPNSTPAWRCKSCMHLYEEKVTQCDCLTSGQAQEWVEVAVVEAEAKPAEPVAWVWNPWSVAWHRVKAYGHWAQGALYAFGPTEPDPLVEQEAAPAAPAPANLRERWNIERDGDDLLVCFNLHDKGEACEYERFVRAPAAPAHVPEADFGNIKPLTDEQIKRMKPVCADFVSFRAGIRAMEALQANGAQP
jgi:hypothetical protein